MTHKPGRSRRGMSRAVAILLVLIIIMALVIAIPRIWHYFKDASAEVGCVQSLDSASRRIAADYLDQFYWSDGQSAEEVKEVAAKAMLGWDDICPAGGTVYVVKTKDEALPYKLVCGLHNKDTKLCTQLNGDYVLSQLRDALNKALALGRELPEDVVVSLHHKDLTVRMLSEPTDLRRGTASSIGHKGTEAWYTRSADGDVEWFVYADEKHAAVWRDGSGWSGDSYS